MPALGAKVVSITQDRFIPKLVDQFLQGNVLTMRLMGKSRTWRGGEQIRVPVNLEQYLQLGSYFQFDLLSVTQQNTWQRTSFTPSQEYVSFPISGIQKAVNSGDAAVVDLIAAEMQQRMGDFKDEIGRQVYLDGTGNLNKDILGLQAAVDDGTTIVNYGGLSRVTFPTWAATVTAQAGGLALADLAADVDAAQRGADMPTLMITTPAVWTIYEALLTPTVRHNIGVAEFRMTAEGGVPINKLGGNQGFRALTFRGIPFVSDERCTAQNIYTLNENHLAFYRIPQPVGFTVVGERGGFGWTGWLQGQNQDAVVGRLQWYGQLICDSPIRQARRTGVAT